MTRLFRAVLLAGILPALLQGWAQAADPVAVGWRPEPGELNRMAVEVSGLPKPALASLRAANWTLPQWPRLLSVYAEQPGADPGLEMPAMLGDYAVKPASVIRFEPQYPLEPGVKYRAVFRPDRLPGASASQQKPIEAKFELAARPAVAPTEVTEVYPTAEVLPENLLKFYLHFSGPMRRGRIYDYLHLRDERGKDVDIPFLEIDEELWNPSMTRLTLFIDPGRIKRGVRPLEEIGPALVAGKRFTLAIDQAWKDANGAPLKQGFERSFLVAPPDRAPLDPARWKLEAPKSGTLAPVRLSFFKPLDHALALRVIQVTDSAGRGVEGQAALADHERLWTFTPASAWRASAYKVVIQTTLEDLAGNNIGKPFEVDLFDGVERTITHSAVTLPFEVR